MSVYLIPRVQARRNRVDWGGEGGAAISQIFAKVDLLTIDNYSEKKNIVKKHKPVPIPRKLLITLPFSTICNAEN